MSSHIQEGLGYTLKYYDPCFNYNADRFCCSERGAKFRENVLMSRNRHTHTADYTHPRNYDPHDRRPVWLQKTGIVDPHNYTLTPQADWDIWCSRMPCSVNQHGVPCQAGMPSCRNPANCGQ